MTTLHDEAVHPTPELLKRHKMTAEEFERLRGLLGRDPSWTELGITSALWSEHCSYKSSKIYLKEFPTTGPHVVQGPGENAGIVDVGHGWVAAFKMESHNHPSFIEPYQGSMTGVGGILRDIFTMGARPIACMDALRFGEIDAPRMRSLIDGVVRGIGDYGNCVGIPTVGGETGFHRCYNKNILVNAFALGIARHDEIFHARASGAGNPVLYVGSRTGRDGIHGATMASDAFDAESERQRPTVQVGDPFTEKIVLEACLEAMRTGAIVAIQDMGAAGLTSSTFEMAGRGGTGLHLVLDRVPLREAGLTPYEMMLSESQERMLMVLHPGREAEAERIFRKWELDFAVIGRITGIPPYPGDEERFRGLLDAHFRERWAVDRYARHLGVSAGVLLLLGFVEGHVRLLPVQEVVVDHRLEVVGFGVQRLLDGGQPEVHVALAARRVEGRVVADLVPGRDADRVQHLGTLLRRDLLGELRGLLELARLDVDVDLHTFQLPLLLRVLLDLLVDVGHRLVVLLRVDVHPQQVLADLGVLRVVFQVILEGLDGNPLVLLVLAARVARTIEGEGREADRAPGEGRGWIELETFLELRECLGIGLLVVERIALLELDPGADLVASAEHRRRQQQKGEKIGRRSVHNHLSAS